MPAIPVEDLLHDDAPVELIPIAALLFTIVAVGLLGPKPGPLSRSVPTPWRCQKCHSKYSRMKLVGPVAKGPTGAVGVSPW